MPSLPPPPRDPLPLASRWLAEAAAGTARNPWAMALATTSASTGRPSARFVLLKGLDVDKGFAVFYTNYGSRKAQELEGAGSAAGVLYWSETGRQLRLEGIVSRSPAAESDAYFAVRPRASQLNAWVSEQSQVLPAGGLSATMRRYSERFPPGQPVPRPEQWGGYRLWLDAVEFWVEGVDRFHERLRYGRRLHESTDTEYAGGDWQHVRLQP